MATPIEKPRVFIGSSTEGLSVAEMVFGILDGDQHCSLWNQGLFRPGTYPMEALKEALRDHHFAVICGTPDDVLVKRGEVYDAVRDNLLLELGLFMGKLGHRRVYLLVPQGRTLSIPTDLTGLTYVIYDAERFELGGSDRHSAVLKACLEVRTAIDLEWGEMRKEQAARVRRILETRRHRAIKRLNVLAVELRDIFVVLPGQVLDSIGKKDHFETTKRDAASRLNSIAEAFEDDASHAGLVPEFEELLRVTKNAILAFPYPDEVMVTQGEAVERLKAVTTEIAGNVFGGGARVGEEIDRAINEELESRLGALGTRYRDWWGTSRPRMAAATTKMQDALTKASIELGGRLLEDNKYSNEQASG